MTLPASDSENTPSVSARRGLLWVLAATAVAGLIGYVIQALVPAFVSPGDYVLFGVYWSLVYLLGSAISGIQQELARAVHFRATPQEPPGWAKVNRFALMTALATGAVVACTLPVWGPSAFSDSWQTLGAAAVAAVCGYALMSAFSGALYGTRAWAGVASLTITDAITRLLLVVVTVMFGAGLGILGWAIAAPFYIAVAALLVAKGRSMAVRVSLDVGLSRLLRNTGSTVVATGSAGVLISGFPFVVGLTAGGQDHALLASLFLVVTLVRAPLVIPFLALQSYLVVIFKDGRRRLGRVVTLSSLALTGAAVMLALAAAWLGPLIIAFLYGDSYVLPGWAFAVIMVGAGLTGTLCITGPGVLAQSKHALFVAGWVASAATMIVILMLPADLLTRAMAAMIVAPLPGIALHATGYRLRKARPASGLGSHVV